LENVMKIGQASDAASIAPATSSAAEASKAARAVPAAGATTEASAKVALSDTVQSLRTDSSASFDADKVARISQQIADGTFKINAEVIADKLIANAQEVLGKVGRG
jgi:negative regulator of flagellin synthesis FlgM